MQIENKIGKYRPNGTWYTRSAGAVTKITVHHSADWQDEPNDEVVLNNLMKAHVNQGWPGLSYHFVYIPKSRKFYQINSFEEVTWHDTINWDSIGILVHGYYHPSSSKPAEVPSKNTLKDLKELLDWLCTQNPQIPADFDDVLGHRERSSTACPGDTLFPYVVEYRTKLGEVKWGEDAPPQEECLKLLQDIPASVEDKYNLKSKDWYSKYWNLEEFIEDSIKTHSVLKAGEEAFKKMQAENKQNKIVLEQNAIDFVAKAKQISTLQQNNTELTAQLAVAGDQVKVAVNERAKAVKEKEAAEKALDPITKERDSLLTTKEELTLKLSQKLSAFSWLEFASAKIKGVSKNDK